MEGKTVRVYVRLGLSAWSKRDEDARLSRRDCARRGCGCQRGGARSVTRTDRGDIMARGQWDDINRGTGKGGFHMLRLTREDGQTMVGYVLALIPLAIVLSFVVAVLVMTS